MMGPNIIHHPNLHNNLNETEIDFPKFLCQQQVEEERLRCDILRYLVNKSSGVYHYSIELRTITLDVVGISFKATQEEFQETETSLLDLLYSDPKRRFSIIGEGDHIFIKRAPLDEDQINELVEEWRCLIAAFLFESKRIVCLSDIGSSVRRPISIPSTVKLIFIIKTDPLNRFVLQGDGNVAKVRFNMQTDPDQESLWVAKWRDDITSFLTKQQWSSPSIGIDGIESHIVRPFFLHQGVQLIDVLQADPFQRFVIMGFGSDARVTIRTFRGDEPEIEKYVESWRTLIQAYLLSKSDEMGSRHLPVGLSKIGAYVARPIGVPASVKLIDVMRTDPMKRFIVNGDGNALRVMINPERQLSEDKDSDSEKALASRTSFNNNHITDHARLQQQEKSLSSHAHNPHKQDMGLVPPGRCQAAVGQHQVRRTSGEIKFPDAIQTVRVPPSPYPPVPKAQEGRSIPRTFTPYQVQMNDQSQHTYTNEHRIRLGHQIQVQQFHQRNLPSAPQQQIQLMGESDGIHHNNSDNRIGQTTRLIQGSLIQGSLPRSSGDRDRGRTEPNLLKAQSFREMTKPSTLDYSTSPNFPTQNLFDRSSLRSSFDDSLTRTGSLERVFDSRKLDLNYTFDGSLSLKSANTSFMTHNGNEDMQFGELDSSTSLLSYSDSTLCHRGPSPTQEISLGRGLGSLFSGGFNPSDVITSTMIDESLSVTSRPEDEMAIPPDKWMIKVWLPIAFEGFDADLIDTFIAKLRDDGGFVTLQDLLDARASCELTIETLADIADFKLGHFIRLQKAMAAFK